MKGNRQEKGITLVALVITIIVILILAGISIATLIGDNGILTKAIEAKKKARESALKEQIEMAVLTARMGDNSTDIDLEKLEEELEKIGVNIEKQGENDDLPWKISKDEFIFQIEDSGEVVSTTGISLNKTILKLRQGEIDTLIATIKGDKTENVTWTSSNPTVATVEDGKVTAVGASGTAKIIASIEGGYSAECIVTIVQEAIEINLTNSEIAVGEEKDILTLVTTQPTGKAKELTYEISSSDVGVVSVDNTTGKILGIAQGTATITVTAKRKDGTALPSKTCTVTVIQKVTSISVSDFEMQKGEQRNIADYITKFPTGVYENLTYELATSNSSIVSVNSSTGKVTGVAVGTATITVIATKEDGTKLESKTCSVKVKVPLINVSDPNIFKEVAGGIVTNYNAQELEWQIFYAEGDDIYLIASDCVPGTKLSSQLDSLSMENPYTYSVCWSGIDENCGATIPINSGIAKKFMLSKLLQFSTSNPNYCMTACFLDSAKWNTFRDSNWADVNDIIGTPTLEMFVASWNKKYPSNLSYTSNNSVGYFAGTQPNPSTTDSVTLSSYPGYKDNLYFPRRGSSDLCFGYWMSSPSAWQVDSNFFVDNRGMLIPSGYSSYGFLGVRPVVHLKSGVGIVEDGSNFKLVE